MLSKLRKEKPILRFRSIRGTPHISDISTIKRAQDVRPEWWLKQKGLEVKDRFHNCPGMTDLMHAGYIIPAFTDLHLKCNSAGTVLKTLNRPSVEMGIQLEPMSQKLVAGVHTPTDIAFQPFKIQLPWAIFARKGYSAYVLPATFHSPFLDDIYVYPGIVDYDGFTTINFIFSMKRACEVEIPAGTPLLQVLPYKRETYSADVAAANPDEMAYYQGGFPTRVRSAYRKFFHKRKRYNLKGATCPFTSA